MSSPLPIPTEQHQQQLNQAGRQKRLKAGTACTNCRRKKLRCTGTPHCARCVTHNLDCVVDEALFLKTNSAQSLYAKTSSSSSRPSQSSSSSHSHRSKSSHQTHQGHHDQGSLSSSSAYSDDEMLERRHSLDFQSDRRMSASSATSISSLSSSPSPGYSYNNYSPSHNTSHSYSSPFQFSSSIPENSNYHTLSDSQSSRPKKISSTKKISRPELNAGPGSQSYSGLSSSSIPSSSSNAASKKRASKDQGSIKPKQKRRNSRPDSDSMLMQNAVRDSDRDPGSPSPLLSPQDSSSSTSGAKEEDFKSVVSTMSLDGHGQQ